jgi:hypothetical protein
LTFDQKYVIIVSIKVRTKDIMSQYTAKAQAYINYINDLRYLDMIEPWKRELLSYQSRAKVHISLPPSTMEDAHKAYDSLPFPQFYKYSALLRKSGHPLIVRDWINL